VRLRGGAGSLDPLPPEVGRDLTADEDAVASIPDADRRARDQGIGIEEFDPLAAVVPADWSEGAEFGIELDRERALRPGAT